ncbi:MAG TPA: ATP-dependent DNA helicase [Gammaproteobacteria bacterium]|nr:ATP-dependent DNA helicase [Gammaproteobacteria bacterium]
MFQSTEVLGPSGPFEKKLEHFLPREQQLEMARAVQNALSSESTLVVEAGTGTGKTFAYLVPALMSGQKVIVSTGTKNLQDQLFHRDIPKVCEVLDLPARVALLKGRSNYLCKYRLDKVMMEGRVRSRTQISHVQKIRQWSGRTDSGDIAEVKGVPEDSPVWSMVTSNVDNCLGSECPSYNGCFVMESRRKAQEADLLVINHHLLFADMSLKEGGYGDLLPGANAFILDEAHTLPDVATQFFGLSLSGRQLHELCKDTRIEHLAAAGDMSDLSEACDHLEKAVNDFRLSLGEKPGRVAWRNIKNKNTISHALDELQVTLGRLCEWLEHAAVRSKGLESCWRRNQEFVSKIDTVTQKEDDNFIQWVDVHRRSFVFHLTPLDISSSFQTQMLAYPCAWVFTSATLAINNDFAHFTDRLGIEECKTLQLDSPFDYADNAMLVAPEQMPDPNSDQYTETVIEYAIPLIEACKGRTFLLFTSHRALRQAEKLLDGRLDYPVYVQGDTPRDLLLESFRDDGNAVLLGTSSFWEGVDVRGSALSLVIIDKLPFASPGDPVLQARIELIKKNGRNAFFDFQLPNAVIVLKQGVGRLIRDVSDKGVMVICDPRLVSKSYGKVFLKSLPPMKRVVDTSKVKEFLEQL